jgi:hypothetical protein
MKAAVIDDPAGRMRVMGQAYVTGDYRIHGFHRTTLMRYIFSTAFTTAPLPLCIVQATTAAALVFFLSALRGFCTR